MIAPASTVRTDIYAVFAAGFLASTLSVRVVANLLRRGSTEGQRSVAATLSAAVLAAWALLAVAGVVPTAWALAAAPVALLAMAVALSPPHPRRLRTVGWVLIGATVLTSTILVWQLR